VVKQLLAISALHVRVCPMLDLLKGDRCCSTSGSDRLQVVHHAFGGQGKYDGDDELGDDEEKGNNDDDQCACW
jgi:hypothetical protein